MAPSSVTVFIAVLHLAQAALCAYGASVSYTAIKLLMAYQKTAEKMAEWSQEYEYKIQKTRSTQLSGALAILSSFIVAVTLALFSAWLPRWLAFSLSPIMLVLTVLARWHMKNFWGVGKPKTIGTRIPLPKMGKYNEAQRQTIKLLDVLQYLEYSWVLASFVNGMIKQ